MALEFFEEFRDALFWSVPFVAAIALTAILGYLVNEDKSKRKVMFMLSTGVASFGHLHELLSEQLGITLIESSYRWSFLPIAVAIYIAAFSNVIQLRDFGNPFKGFLLALAVSVVMLVVPANLDMMFLLSYSVLGIVALVTLTYSVVKRREISDLLFLQAFACFLISAIAADLGLIEEFTPLLALFGMVFIGLMFAVSKTSPKESMASFITLEKKLVSAKEELEASEERYRNLCEDARILMLRTDTKGNITFVNRMVEEYGFTKEDVAGKNMRKFVPKKHWLKLLNARTKVNQGHAVDGEIEIGTPKGKIIAEYRSGPIKAEGKIVGGLTIIRNITERKEMEEKLEGYANQLEEKVKERTQDLENTQKQLEQYSQHLEELVDERTRQLKGMQEQLLRSERLAAIGELASMVGHDLRNPLQGISNATYYLKRKMHLKLDDEEREMLELVEENMKYSDKIINDLLDYSRETQLELAEATPQLIVRQSTAVVEFPENIRVVDETQNEPRMKVDVEKMKRVFVNLMKNAVDAMPTGGILTIRSQVSDGNLKFTFSDTGDGMPKETLERIWTPLFTTKAKGMGLGLAVCKRIVEAHGGKISAESSVGKGTTLTVTIPIEPEQEGGEEQWMKAQEYLSSTTTQA